MFEYLASLAAMYVRVMTLITSYIRTVGTAAPYSDKYGSRKVMTLQEPCQLRSCACRNVKVYGNRCEGITSHCILRRPRPNLCTPALRVAQLHKYSTSLILSFSGSPFGDTLRGEEIIAMSCQAAGAAHLKKVDASNEPKGRWQVDE